jgi:hypothetical protein
MIVYGSKEEEKSIPWQIKERTGKEGTTIILNGILYKLEIQNKSHKGLLLANNHTILQKSKTRITQ